MYNSAVGIKTVVAALLVVSATTAWASAPASENLAVPAAVGTVTTTWTGTVPFTAGGAATNSCDTDPSGVSNDVHTVNLTVPKGLYDQFLVKATFKIHWVQTMQSPQDFPDLVLTVQKDGKTVASSDTSADTESVGVTNPLAGTYTALGCSFASAPPGTDYTGTLTLQVSSAATASAPPSVGAAGLEFSASLVDELQFFEGEPLVTLDSDGTIYTCGPAGSGYPAADYAQASIDGGDQFNRLGDPTTGRLGLQGGGDCALATGAAKNSKGNYQLAYAGLSNLVQFTVSTSPDKGQTISNSPFSSTAPVADRQWLAFTDAMTVFLSYKNEQTFGVVHKSTDGGMTYAPAQIISPSPTVVGAIHSMSMAENPAHNGMAALYYPWVSGTSVALAISQDAGSTWNNCTITTSQGAPNSLFPAADHDAAGNLYVVYTDQADFNTYLVTVPASELANCKGGSGPAAVVTGTLKASKRTQMNRDKVVATIMPWVAVGGVPGRVAVSFYGSEVPGAVDSATLPHVWNVYVSQSLNALDAAPAVAQVKATTHPMHYDQICIGGLGCQTGGDRSLSDFFAIAYNRANGELDLVFDRSGKKPGDGIANSGPVTATTFIRQIAGPSNGGGTVAGSGRPVLRQATADPVGDAYGGFSALVVTPTRTQLPALDFNKVSVDPALDLVTGALLPAGGFTVTMKLKDLSNTALSNALSSTSGGQSLVWMFYYWDGFTPTVAQASWSSSGGFVFGGGGAVQSMTCMSPSQASALLGCAFYPNTNVLKGKVDQAAGTVKITVPLAMVHALANVPAPARSPAQVLAQAGDRIYSAAAYSFVNVSSTDQSTQALVTVDNTAAMDFLVPGKAAAAIPVTSPGTTPASATVPISQAITRSAGGGGAFGLMLLLPFTGLALARRRRRC